MTTGKAFNGKPYAGNPHVAPSHATAAMVAFAGAAILMANTAAAYTYLEWAGTAESPVWDTTSVNWINKSNGDAATAFFNSDTFARFTSGGLQDVTVQSEGITTSGMEVKGGNHTLNGGAVNTGYIDPSSGVLTIYNRVVNTSGEGLRMMGGEVRIGDGGYLETTYAPSNTSTIASRLTVFTNGTLKAAFSQDAIKSCASTLYFDGGTLIHTYDTYNNPKTFTNSKLVLGAGGMHIGERLAGQRTYLPGPIGTDSSLPTDGGLITDDHTGYIYMHSVANTYRGGLHIAGNGGYVGLVADRALGEEPASPSDVVFFECPSGTVASTFVAHGNVSLGAKRNIRIATGVTARLGTYNDGSEFTIKSTISCENPENGFLLTANYSSQGGTAKGVILDPGAGRTNHIGRLFVKRPLTIASGTTMLENTTYIGSDTGYEQYGGTDDGSVLHVQAGGTLKVTGGELVKIGGRNVTQNGTLLIEGGVVDIAGSGGTVFQANSAPAVTTVKNGGRLNVQSIRMAGSGNKTDASKSVLNVMTGGVVRCSDIYIHQNNDTYKATVNFDGGILEFDKPGSNHYLGNTTPSINSLPFNVGAGGMIVSNDCELLFCPAVKSGVAAGETDGGITKWGTGSFSLRNAGNTFNGPLVVMQGAFRLDRSDAIPATGTARVAAGAYFYATNQQSQALARIEGSGTFGMVVHNGTRLLTVTSAIAPGMGTNEVGTLTISGGGINISNGAALEIDVDAEGNSDCLSYPDDLDLSGLTLHVNDVSKLDRSCCYTIVKMGQNAILSGEFSATNLPSGWICRYYKATRELKLTPLKGTLIVFK